MRLLTCKNYVTLLHRLKADYKVIVGDDSILALKILIYGCAGIQKRSGRQYTKILLTEVGSKSRIITASYVLFSASIFNDFFQYHFCN